MRPSIELINLTGAGTYERVWDHGPQRVVAATPSRLSAALRPSTADAVLCLDARLPVPSPETLDRLLDGPGDAWHSGLLLGLDGHPRAIDYVNPLWMLNAPANPSLESTSWRLSLRALLVRTTVLDQLGGPARGFDTLSGVGLDLGLRWTLAGALVRHTPDLAAASAPVDSPPTDIDGLRIISRQYGRQWAGWSLARGAANHELSCKQLLRLGRTILRTGRETTAPYLPPGRAPGSTDRTVSVIVPTIDRYAYLEPLLHQLAAQTVPPHEVIIADQTPQDRRRSDLARIEPSLPVTVIGLPIPGQSTARNAAIQRSTGELLLFIDDDDEIGPDLIGAHMERMTDGIDASCGGVDDATAGPPPEGFQHRRASDVFPTNNTMLRREALQASGLFDLVYDRGSRADHDLGMRLHQQGAMLLYDPSVLVFHHHAPAGGLRSHGARTVTRAGARRSLRIRHLPSTTELYLGRRYFTDRQNRENGPIRLFSLLAGEGSVLRQVLRAVVQIVLLPSSARQIAASQREASLVLADRPSIPPLDGNPARIVHGPTVPS
jgi:GT2 family glycosyltransferase